MMVVVVVVVVVVECSACHRGSGGLGLWQWTSSESLIVVVPGCDLTFRSFPVRAALLCGTK